MPGGAGLKALPQFVHFGAAGGDVAAGGTRFGHARHAPCRRVTKPMASLCVDA